MINQRKLRIIKSEQKNACEVTGITIPPEIAKFFRGVYFNVTRSGTDIILASGTQLSQISKQIKIEADTKKIDLEDYKI